MTGLGGAEPDLGPDPVERLFETWSAPSAATGRRAAVAAQTAQGVLSQAQTVQQSISGVNLDQQAANLVSFEQAYQAAASVIGTRADLFASLIAAVGRLGGGARQPCGSAPTNFCSARSTTC